MKKFYCSFKDDEQTEKNAEDIIMSHLENTKLLRSDLYKYKSKEIKKKNLEFDQIDHFQKVFLRRSRQIVSCIEF